MPNYILEKNLPNWKYCQSPEKLKELIRLLIQQNSQLIRDFDVNKVDCLKHDLEIRKGYEQACEKVHQEIKPILEQLGEEAAETSDPQLSISNNIFGGLLPQVVQENVKKLKLAVAAKQQAYTQALQIKQRNNQEQAETITTQEQTITTQEQTIHQKQQRILALEADKQDLLHQLTQAHQKHQNHLTQEKSLCQQEIQLIKEVIQ